MARPLKPTKIATFNHAKVVYSPFKADPGAQFVLTADPWSFLTATINQKLAERPRGENRARHERALYFATLAESFYASARHSTLPTAGTLAYYGVLNLVKCFLSLRKVNLETQIEHHGLTLPLGQKQTVQVIANPTNSLSIFHEFARLLGKPVQGKTEISLKEFSAHMPEIHEMAFTLGHIEGKKRRFLPIEIRFLFSEEDDFLSSEVSYEKKQITRVDTSKLYSGARKSYFRDAFEKDEELIHCSKRRKRCNWDNLPRKYANICADYKTFDIASLLTARGYKYYCDLSAPPYHHLSYSLMMMYYIGTAARYRPSEMSNLLSSDLRPLISEALAVTPGQMLYHIVSLSTEEACVVPHATIAA
jgi:hypothetical protein